MMKNFVFSLIALVVFLALAWFIIKGTGFNPLLSPVVPLNSTTSSSSANIE